jgi:hypothetical protein
MFLASEGIHPDFHDFCVTNLHCVAEFVNLLTIFENFLGKHT